MLSKSIKQEIKNQASCLGISHLGFASIQAPRNYDKYVIWTQKGYAGDMWYLTENTRMKKRASLLEVFPKAQSVLVAAFSYKPQHNEHATNAKFARYGWGEDYHFVLKEKLEALMDWIKQNTNKNIEYKIYVDTAPILEKDIAQTAGVGWIGKNTCLINQKSGSYLLIAEVLTDLEFSPDTPATQHCGSCTKCLDACPTDAFIAPFQMDATKCISYHTIENKNLEMPEEISKNLQGWVAGCDICQEVCPWNHKSPATTIEEFFPGPHTQLPLEKILELTQDEYDQKFAKTSFKRIPLAKLKANAKLNLK